MRIRIKNHKHRTKFDLAYHGSLLTYLLLFCFFPPASLKYILPMSFDLDWIYHLLRTGIGATSVAIYLLRYKLSFSRSVFAMIVFCGAYAMFSLFTNIKIDYTFFFAVSVIGVACFLEIWVKIYGIKVFSTVWKYFMLMFILNSIFLILSPDGVYRRYVETHDYYYWAYDVYERISFISGDNGFMVFGIPLWLAGMLLLRRKLLSRKQFLAGLFIVNVNVLFIFSVTSLLGLAVLDGMTFLLMRKKPINISWRKVVLIIIFANIVVVGFGTSGLIMRLVDLLFSKSLTFSIRTDIWHECFDLFLDSPLLGHGNENSWYCIESGGRTYAAHNMCLAILIQGGVALFTCFLYLLQSIVRGVRKKSRRSDEYVICGVMLCIGIMGTAETLVQNFGFWMLLSLIAASKYLSPVQDPQQTDLATE